MVSQCLESHSMYFKTCIAIQCYTCKIKRKLHDMMPLDSLSLQSLLVKLLDIYFSGFAGIRVAH